MQSAGHGSVMAADIDAGTSAAPEERWAAHRNAAKRAKRLHASTSSGEGEAEQESQHAVQAGESSRQQDDLDEAAVATNLESNLLEPLRARGIAVPDELTPEEAWDIAHSTTGFGDEYDEDPLMDPIYPGCFAALTVMEGGRPPRGQSRGTTVTIHGKSIPQHTRDQSRFLGIRTGLDGERATLLKWLDGQWELRLERNGERVLVGQGELKPVAGALYVGAEATMQGLSTAAELNGATAKVLRWDEAKDRWAVRVGERSVLAKASNLQLRPSRHWTGMSSAAMRECTDPPPCVPCEQLFAHNATLPRDFLAFNEDGRTVYVHLRSGRRSLYAPTAVDGRPRGYEPKVPSGFSDSNGGFACCGDVRCNVCAEKRWDGPWRDGVPKPYPGARKADHDEYFSTVGPGNFYEYPSDWRERVAEYS